MLSAKEYNTTIDSDISITINSIYNKILKVKSYITDINIVPKFNLKMRIWILKYCISYFERNEEYEKCSILMKILNKFNCIYFNTRNYY